MNDKAMTIALHCTTLFSILVLTHMGAQISKMGRKNRKAVAEIQADHMAVLKEKLDEVAALSEDGTLEIAVAQSIVDIQVEKAVLEVNGYYWWASTFSKLVFCRDVSLARYRKDCEGISL